MGFDRLVTTAHSYEEEPMTDQSRPDEEAAHAPIAAPQPPGMPRWVKVTLVVVGVLVLVAVGAVLFGNGGGGGHGPGMHGAFSVMASPAAPSPVSA